MKATVGSKKEAVLELLKIKGENAKFASFNEELQRKYGYEISENYFYAIKKEFADSKLQATKPTLTDSRINTNGNHKKEEEKPGIEREIEYKNSGAKQINDINELVKKEDITTVLHDFELLEKVIQVAGTIEQAKEILNLIHRIRQK